VVRIRRYRWVIALVLIAWLAFVFVQMHWADGIAAGIKAMHGG
jgi:hypothetical protein